jgi:hypothetical protein
MLNDSAVAPEERGVELQGGLDAAGPAAMSSTASPSRALLQATPAKYADEESALDDLQAAIENKTVEEISIYEVVRKKAIFGRKYVKKILDTGDVGMALDIINVTMSLLACGLYVIGVDVLYDTDTNTESVVREEVLRTTEQTVTLWFCFDYLMRMFIADNAFEYFMENKIDLISILPGIVDFIPPELNIGGDGAGTVIGILGIARVLKVLRLLRLQRLISHFGDDEVMKQAFFMLNIFVFVIFFGAGLYHFTENQNEALRSRFGGEGTDCRSVAYTGFDMCIDEECKKTETMLDRCLRIEEQYAGSNFEFDHENMDWIDWLLVLFEQDQDKNLSQGGSIVKGNIMNDSYAVMWAKANGIWFDFGTSAYFVVVTMTTVGFGDFNPSTGLSRFLTSFLIIFTVVLVPMQTNELLTRINEQSVYNKRKYTVKKGHIHVVVAGAVNSNGLNYFVNEFFNADQLTEEIEAIVDMVVMAPSAPSQDVVDLIEDPNYLGQIFYIAGSVLSGQDLKRVSFSEAKAIWLLSDKFSLTPSLSDNLTVIRSLALRRFLSDTAKSKPEVELPQVFSQLIQPSSRDKLESRGAVKDDVLGAVLCLDEIKSVILAKSCTTPGIFTLLNNLVTSASAPDPKAKLARWEREYQQGRDHEIYRVKLAAVWNKQKFQKIADVAFKNYELLLIAVEHEKAYDHNGKPTLEDGEIHVAPENLVIDTTREAWAYVITEDKASANKLGSTNPTTTNLAPSSRVVSPNKMSRSQSLRTLGDAVLESEISNGSVTSPYGGGSPEQGRRLSASRESRKSFTVDTSASGLTSDSVEPPSPTTPGMRTTKDSIKLLTNESYALSFVHEEKRPLREGIIQSVDELLPEGTTWDMIPRKRRHTIVCAYTSDLYHFIAPLRSKISTDEMTPVVVIVRDEYAAKVWEPISIFHDVYVVIGSPSNAEDLIRAGILYAQNLIVYANTESSANVNLHGDRNTPESTKALDEVAAMADSDTIFINSAVTIMNPTIQIVSELVHWGNIPYLNDSHPGAILERCRKDVIVWPLVSAGNVYVASLNDYLSAQLFHNPSLVSLLEKIVIGDRKANNGVVSETTMELVSPYAMHSPNGVALEEGSTWGDVFGSIIKQYSAIPIALYRSVTLYGEEGTVNDFENRMPYVLTNPPPHDTIVRKQDRVFILCNDRTASKLKQNTRSNGSPSGAGLEENTHRLGGAGMPRRRLSKTVVEDMSLQDLTAMTQDMRSAIQGLSGKIDGLKR